MALDQNFDHRLGRFMIAEDLLRNNETLAQMRDCIMSRVVILDCRHDHLGRYVEYVAWGQEFVAIAPSYLIPMYSAQLRTELADNGTRSVHFDGWSPAYDIGPPNSRVGPIVA